MTVQSPEIEKKERLQRVRIGATGLVAVVLVVMSAGALTHGASDETPVDKQIGVETPGGLSDLSGGNSSNASKSQEPLAELGVAPNPQSDDASNAGQGPRP